MMLLLRQRPIATLNTLVLFHLLLLSVQIRNEQGSTLLRAWGLMVLSPVAAGMNFLVATTQQVLDSYLFLWGAQERNRELALENARLRLELYQLRGLQSLVERTRGLERVQEPIRFESTLASIIWKGNPFLSHRFVVNVGSAHGIRRDAAVLTPDGIVGRVYTVTPLSAEVELICNANAAAGALLQDSRLQGVVQGDGTERLKLNFIPNYESVEAGEIVYTSGTDRIYPKGLPIGRVVESSEGVNFREILLEPLVDFARLEEVLVVVSSGSSASRSHP